MNPEDQNEELPDEFSPSDAEIAEAAMVRFASSAGTALLSGVIMRVAIESDQPTPIKAGEVALMIALIAVSTYLGNQAFRTYREHR